MSRSNRSAEGERTATQAEENVVASDSADIELWNQRKIRVVEAFKHAWNGYKRYAFGKDHLKPISKSGEDWYGLGLTITDSLDTMYLMGLKDILEEGEYWVEHELKFTKEANLFETTIRLLASLLSIYGFTKKPIYLKKAVELADILLVAFDSPSGVPYATVNLRERLVVYDGDSTTAEVSSIQLSFRYLSHLTGDDKYRKAVDKVIDIIDKLPKFDGLVPIFISPVTGKWTVNEIRLGSRGDSYYIQTGQKEPKFLEMFDEALKGIHSHLTSRTVNGFVFVGELLNGQGSFLHPKMDHLVCFLPGTILLRVTMGKTLSEAFPDGMDDANKANYELAKELLRTCYEMYRITPTKLAPEIVYFNTKEGDDLYIKPADRHNLLRPETVESLYIFYQITGEDKYRDWGYEIFEAFEKYSRVESGYTCLRDVTQIPSPPIDKMESFFLAETLKYFYLLFHEDPFLISLDKYVFNTEAHPLPIFNWQDQS